MYRFHVKLVLFEELIVHRLVFAVLTAKYNPWFGLAGAQDSIHPVEFSNCFPFELRSVEAVAFDVQDCILNLERNATLQIQTYVIHQVFDDSQASISPWNTS
jgi:hypothetical protein